MAPNRNKEQKTDDVNNREEYKRLSASIFELKTLVQSIKENQQECTKSQEHICKEYDSFAESQKDILDQLKLMQHKVDKLTVACEMKDKENESVADIVTKVAAKSGVILRCDDIQAAHRVPTRVEGRPRPIIAELSSRVAREKIVSCKEHITNDDVIGDHTGGKIFVYPQISPELKTFRWKAKQRAKEVSWKFVWIKDGALLAKKSEDTRTTLKIFSESDLAKMC